MQNPTSALRGSPPSCSKREGTTFSRAVKASRFCLGTAEGRALPAAALIIILLTLNVLPSCSPHPHIVVGCKNFTAQIVPAELIAQQIEHKTHLPAQRHFYLRRTHIEHQSILPRCL